MKVPSVEYMPGGGMKLHVHVLAYICTQEINGKKCYALIDMCTSRIITLIVSFT